MNIIKVKIATLKRPDKNVRIHTETQLKEFVRSVNMFGQIRPIVVDESNTILAGNGLLEALIKAGKDEADIYKIDGLSENQKKKLMIADNKIFNLGVENLETLNEFINELQYDLDIPGFDEDILKAMVSDAEDITDKISEYGVLPQEEIAQIKEREVKFQEQGAIVSEYTREPEPAAKPREDITETKKCVECPKCGEQIWL